MICRHFGLNWKEAGKQVEYFEIGINGIFPAHKVFILNLPKNMALHHINRALLGFIDVFPNEKPQDKNFYISKIGSQTIYTAQLSSLHSF